MTLRVGELFPEILFASRQALGYVALHPVTKTVPAQTNRKEVHHRSLKLPVHRGLAKNYELGHKGTKPGRPSARSQTTNWESSRTHNQGSSDAQRELVTSTRPKFRQTASAG